ncbi:MAG: hypothetical protein IPL26_21470 [Leptospiraceae bacterium]|nr:hypothetical protein [Leptospiraceae bacterium]
MNIVSDGLEHLAHRGKDSRRIIDLGNNLVIGYNRLAINDLTENANQPFLYKNWAWVCNGEIYNYKTLKRLTNYKYSSDSDIECLLPLFLKYGISFINLLDGMFAGVFIDLQNNLFYSFKDYWGIKPLYKIRTNENIIFTSELKSYKGKINSFESIETGITIFDFNGKKINKIKIKKNELKKTKSLKFYIEKSVKKRIPPKNIKTGILLSGGVDSAIIAYLSLKYRSDIFFITVGLKNTEDIKYAKIFVEYFKLNDRHIIFEINEKDLLRELKSTIFYLEKFNPSNVSNGLMTYLACKKASEFGIKVLLCGEGADELFAGYKSFINSENFVEERSVLINNMKDTELLRLDRTSMAFHIEARVPFLEKKIHQLSNRLSKSQLIQISGNTALTKVILRNLYKDEIPDEILYRPKNPFDVGSGGRKIIELIPNCSSENFCDYDGIISNEMKYYYKIWKELYYNYSNTNTDFRNFGDYPVFMKFIEKRKTTQN